MFAIAGRKRPARKKLTGGEKAAETYPHGKEPH